MSPDDSAGEPAAAEAPVGVQVGERAPDFESVTLDGESVALSDYRGQVVLLNFWATWCGPCREEMPDFEAIYQQRAADGFTVLAVNFAESPEQVAAFVDELGLSFPVVMDESGEINGDVYGSAVSGYPTSLLLDRDGVIVRRFPGRVNTADLLSALDSLDAG
jgi:peroxiredoxin